MRYALIISATALMSLSAQAQVKVADITLDKALTKNTGGKTLVCNGGGLREKFWLDLYVGGLYLPTKNKDGNKVMMADETMAIKIWIVSGLITSEKMVDAVEEGFEKSNKYNKPAATRQQIDKFKNCFSAEIKEGDVFEIIYVKGKGTTVYKNSKTVDSIPGAGFKKALWGIWFCKEPADEDLMEGMLGL